MTQKYKERLGVLPLICFLVLCGQLVAQSAVSANPATSQDSTFDVISIRPSVPGGTGYSIRPRVDDFLITGGRLKFLVAYAYGIHDFQVTGLPAQLQNARFDIAAKAERPDSPLPRNSIAEKEELRARLRALLASRFHLRAHFVKTVLPVYSLEAVRGGPKVIPSTKNTGYLEGYGIYRCSSASMNDLADMLADSTDHIVQNKTGLGGEYAFTLEWTPDERQDANSVHPGLFTALQEQLGLRLVSAKAPVDVIMVDFITEPTPN